MSTTGKDIETTRAGRGAEWKQGMLLMGTGFLIGVTKIAYDDYELVAQF